MLSWKKKKLYPHVNMEMFKYNYYPKHALLSASNNLYYVLYENNAT